MALQKNWNKWGEYLLQISTNLNDSMVEMAWREVANELVTKDLLYKMSEIIIQKFWKELVEIDWNVVSHSFYIIPKSKIDKFEEYIRYEKY